MNNLFLSIKKLLKASVILIFMAFLVVLGFWSSRNSHLVTWDLMVHPEPAQFQMSTVMAVLLFSGFILGMLTSFYVISRLKLSRALKQRKADQEAKKQAQNKALTDNHTESPQSTALETTE